jgi:peptidoglycan biosynthesis protein MviN/MurJ (putative lipid II flippase)
VLIDVSATDLPPAQREELQRLLEAVDQLLHGASVTAVNSVLATLLASGLAQQAESEEEHAWLCAWLLRGMHTYWVLQCGAPRSTTVQ